MNLYDIKINSLDGTPINLKAYKGQFILFVNVASECGFTSQYDGLQRLYDNYKGKLMVIGVPCNQFGQQEPGSNQQIKSFCKENYGVSFIMSEKIDDFRFKHVSNVYSQNDAGQLITQASFKYSISSLL